MSYCTNAADDGRQFRIFGAGMIRMTLPDPNISNTKKDELLREERAAVADYYNWLFDREQERKSK